MTTVAIIGAGEIGGATAQALAARDCVRRVLLVDQAAGIAAGKALDIQQAGAINGSHTQLSGTDDVSRVAGYALHVIADRADQPGVEWHGDEGWTMLSRLVSYAGSAPMVFAGATQADLMLAAGRDARIARARLIGSAPQAFVAAATAIVAMEANTAATEITLTAVGAPGDLVVPFSEASIGGYALERVLSQAQIARIQARLVRLWPPGDHTLGRAAAQMVEAALTASRTSLSALTLLDGELGVRHRVGALPVRLAPTGIVERRVPTLNPRERVLLETALGAP